jgi:hypothetical protein
MNYRFTYDKEFKESNIFMLSDDEIKIVIATLCGEHNALFFGYNPERLVNVIKKLTEVVSIDDCTPMADLLGIGGKESILKTSDKKVLHLKNVNYFSHNTMELIGKTAQDGGLDGYCELPDDDSQLDRYSVGITPTLINTERIHIQSNFQLIASTDDCVFRMGWLPRGYLSECFDVVFKCKAPDKDFRFETPLSRLKERLRLSKQYCKQFGRSTPNNKIKDLDDVIITSGARSYYRDIVRSSGVEKATRVLRVARSLADFESHVLVRVNDMARSYQNLSFNYSDNTY